MANANCQSGGKAPNAAPMSLETRANGALMKEAYTDGVVIMAKERMGGMLHHVAQFDDGQIKRDDERAHGKPQNDDDERFGAGGRERQLFVDLAFG